MALQDVLICTNLLSIVLLGAYVYRMRLKVKRANLPPTLSLLVTIDQSREDGWFSEIHKVVTYGQICVDTTPVGPRFVLAEQLFEDVKEENIKTAIQAVQPIVGAGVNVRVSGGVAA